ncbi:MAG: microcin ABC transporter ATP-binding protein, partial [Deltaproteobacteria bacterium]|nr:microcin ABC transporter ATP-binding protein [Deltaproteobacteria bacterium]
QAHVLKLLKALQKKTGVASVFISHDLGVVKMIADNVIVLREGRIVDSGPTETVFKNPTHNYTRCLLAAASRGTYQP